jgi:hypothetical protein
MARRFWTRRRAPENREGGSARPFVPPDPNGKSPGRQRDRRFCEIVKRVGFPTSDEATVENIALARSIAKEAWPSVGRWKSDLTVLTKVRSKLAEPEIREALETVYSEQGFPRSEAIRTHIDHIRGEHTKQVVIGNEVAELRMPASFPALADYETMVGMMPPPPDRRRKRR